MKQSLLFACTGNYYRSRFAEIYFNHLAEQAGLRVSAISRGLEVFKGHNSGAISGHAVDFLQELQVEVPSPTPFPEQMTEFDFDTVQRIILMDRTEHYPMMQLYFPERVEQVEFWDFQDVQFLHPREMLPNLQKAVRDLILAYEEAWLTRIR